MASAVTRQIPAAEPEPAWDIARLFPNQGFWDERDYLALDTNHLVEFTDGYVEVLPMPKPLHQRIVAFLLNLIHALASSRKLGEILMAPMPVRLRSRQYREPDLVFLFHEHADRKHDDCWERPDLVVEVVSEDAKSHRRDYELKRSDYAQAGVREWIVDPQTERITVLKLAGKEYDLHGEFSGDQIASSSLLPGFEVSAKAVFAAGRGE